jgi:alpha-glucosidase
MANGDPGGNGDQDRTPDLWWKGCVAYQIYPRSFLDTSGNGVGDLPGIRSKLDHLTWLGVDAIWLSPFYASPMADYGYDVSDFCDVDPLFGDLGEFDRLVADAHELGIRVVIDWVPNHSSDRHPWFIESRSSRDNPKRDWYIWRDPPDDGSLPNNWIEALTFGPAWTLDEATGQYYLHNFFSSQPDLNWDQPELAASMLDTLRFWLDRGVDGFRMDVVNLIGKDPALPDDPPELDGLPHVIINDTPQTHAHLKDIRQLLDSYPDDRMAIGEVIAMGIDKIVTHLGDGDELNLAFNFPPMHQPWSAPDWERAIRKTEAVYDAAYGWPTWVLSNHDAPRHRTRFGGSEPIARAAAVLMLTLRGTVFLYAGEEVGLEDAVVPEDRRHDPGGRDGCRAPIPWNGSPTHGWASDEPWLPWPPDAEHRNVEDQRADDGSIIHLYRRLLSLRHEHAALVSGSLEVIDSPGGVVAYRRGGPADSISVAINFTADEVEIGDVFGPDASLLVSSIGRDRFAGVLSAEEAIVVTGH